MSEYQVIARRFRPQTFRDVVGQEAIVTTLKNAIRSKRLAQAYLFCGSRGTGKTTLARILAKALNCQSPTPDLEPCNQCSTCREITQGSSLDILEIDGASNRGIEDIRQINENVGYASASGYKIYIIDEVHMLTKEAFNALLKTLEEPPAKVKFFFATTEPHKVPTTILSRCQRFNLRRIPAEKIVSKLQFIAKQLNVDVEEEALHLLAQHAEGGLRDAESLFDQILAFEEGQVTVASINSILGLMSRDAYFELDKAGEEGDFAKAFEIAYAVFSQGKDIMHFIEGLIEHIRTILLTLLSEKAPRLLTLSEKDKERYDSTSRLYTQEQCLTLLDYLMDAQNQLRFSTFSRIMLESILLHVMKSHFCLPIELLVRRLSELEQAIQGVPATATPSEAPKAVASKPVSPPIPKATTPAPVAAPQAAVIAPSPSNLHEDPTPTPADLGLKPKPKQEVPLQETKKAPSAEGIALKPSHHYDTLFHFAAVELEGKVQKLR